GLYPLPNFASSSRYNYQVPLVGITDSDAVMLNLNKTFNMKNQMNGQLGFQKSSADTPSIFGFLDTTDTTGLNTTVNFSHRFTTRFFARFGFQYSRLTTRTTPFFANGKGGNISGNAGILGNNQDPSNWGPPTLGFSSGISALTDANSSLDRNQT